MKTTESGQGCCGTLGAELRQAMPARAMAAPMAASAHDETMTVAIPAGRAEIGTDQPVFPVDGEGPRRFIDLPAYRMDEAAVTNERFAAFVAATGHVTEAEGYGWSFVFERDVAGPAAELQRPEGALWWCRVDGASWRQPEGPGSTIEHRLDHPVVHVSHRDAQAFAGWAGGRLPSEAQWEHAARGGLKGARYPWGDDEPGDDGPFPCNIWQGSFPQADSGADGHRGTAPARSFAANGYGLYNMCGNVWEWCAEPFRVRSLKRAAQQLNLDAARERRQVLKGGSFLCHRSYCHRYRIAARIGSAPDSSTSHMGFRLVYPA